MMEEVALSIQQSYPGVLKLAQTPRWLTTESGRWTSTKGMSTVVLSIAGQHTLQSLGHQFCQRWHVPVTDRGLGWIMLRAVVGASPRGLLYALGAHGSDGI